MAFDTYRARTLSREVYAINGRENNQRRAELGNLT